MKLKILMVLLFVKSLPEQCELRIGMNSKKI